MKGGKLSVNFPNFYCLRGFKIKYLSRKGNLFVIASASGDSQFKIFKAGRTGNDVLSFLSRKRSSKKLYRMFTRIRLAFTVTERSRQLSFGISRAVCPEKSPPSFLHNTAHSNKLNAQVAIPVWDKKNIRIMLEQDIIFTEEGYGLSTAGRLVCIWFLKVTDWSDCLMRILPRIIKINEKRRRKILALKRFRKLKVGCLVSAFFGLNCLYF